MRLASAHAGGRAGGRQLRGDARLWMRSGRMERSMTDWNYADVWETVADVQPDAVAVPRGRGTSRGRSSTAGPTAWPSSCSTSGWRSRTRWRSTSTTRPEYLQATFAAMKVGLVPVNTNYRYGDDELAYLWDNADAVAVVFHGAFTERIERDPGPGPPGQGLALGRRRLGPVPGLGDPLRGRRQVGRRPRARAMGSQRRRPLHALHRRHDRDAQGRHVAPGRPLRPADRRRRPPLRRRRRASRAVRGVLSGERPAASPCCRPAR